MLVSTNQKEKEKRKKRGERNLNVSFLFIWSLACPCVYTTGSGPVLHPVSISTWNILVIVGKSYVRGNI